MQKAAAKPAATTLETITAVNQAVAPPSMEQVAQAVKNINKSMQMAGQGVEFTVDSDTKQVVVKVIDRETKEVLRQMPTKEALEIAKALDQSSGILIRQKA